MHQEAYHREHQCALQSASLGEAQSGPIGYKNVKETHQAHRADSVVSANCRCGKGQSRCNGIVGASVRKMRDTHLMRMFIVNFSIHKDAGNINIRGGRFIQRESFISNISFRVALHTEGQF